MIRCVLIGKLPGPIGGVTRFNAKLKARFGLWVAYNWMQYVKALLSPINLFHISLSSLKHISFLLVLSKAFRKTVIVTFHRDITRYLVKDRRLFFFACKLIDEIIVLSNSNQRLLLNHGIKSVLIPNYFKESGAIEDKGVKYLGSDRRNFSKVVVTMCYKRVEINGVDVYGIIELLQLAELFPDYLWVLVNPTNEYPEWAGKNLFYINKEISMEDLFQETDIYIRNTITDGDSLTVYEALSNNNTVLATTVADRPPGTLLYSNVKELKSLLSKDKCNATPLDIECAYVAYRNLYHKYQ